MYNYALWPREHPKSPIQTVRSPSKYWGRSPAQHTTLLLPQVSGLRDPSETATHRWPQAYTLLLSSCPVRNRCGINPHAMLLFLNASLVNYKVMTSLFIFSLCAFCQCYSSVPERIKSEGVEGGIWDPFILMMIIVSALIWLNTRMHASCLWSQTEDTWGHSVPGDRIATLRGWGDLKEGGRLKDCR